MSDQPKLSKRQQDILRMIRDFSLKNGYPPSIREIGEATSISSTSVVSYNLDILSRKGYLTRDRDVSRGLRVLDGTIRVPFKGEIAAGEPLSVLDDAYNDTDVDSVGVPADMLKDTSKVYALQVRGTSMIDAYINDGDIVLIRHQETADNGDMVVAWLKEEKTTTLKRFFRDPARRTILLKPENPTMKPIEVHPNNLEVQGRVVGVIRRLD